MNRSKRKDYRYSYGVKILLSNNKFLRKLKKRFAPTNHGHKVWTTSWLLIDYICKTNNFSEKRVLDIGCGWGIAGIYCAKKHGASVTCVDIDEEVYPFLTLMANANKVKIDFLCRDINSIKRNILKDIDIVIASDICFNDSLFDQLRRFIQRAKMASVQQIIIADPCRWPFEKLLDIYDAKRDSEITPWKTKRPRYTNGKILNIKY